MKIYRAGAVAAGVIAAALALAACSSSSSSGGSDSGSTQAAGGGGSSSSSSSGGSIDCTGAGNLNSDGSTAQQNAVNAWIKAYDAACGKTIVYSGGGSGQGVTDFNSGKVDFAGSDAALNPDAGEVAAANKQCGSPALDIPMVTGPIAVAFHVSGVDDLTLTPTLMGKIFKGKITQWDDSAIKKENPNADLPSKKINVFYRSDESGTTQNFETYLNTVDKTDFPGTPDKDWSGTGAGKNLSQGVQQALTSTDDSISYIELSYTGGLKVAKVDSGSGAVALTATSVGKAVAAAQSASHGGNDLTLKLNYATKAAGAYPILLVTYEIVCQKYKDAATGAAVKSFLTYTSSDAGQQVLNSIGSAPLPDSVLSKVQATVAKIS